MKSLNMKWNRKKTQNGDKKFIVVVNLYSSGFIVKTYVVILPYKVQKNSRNEI